MTRGKRVAARGGSSQTLTRGKRWPRKAAYPDIIRRRAPAGPGLAPAPPLERHPGAADAALVNINDILAIALHVPREWNDLPDAASHATSAAGAVLAVAAAAGARGAWGGGQHLA
jgi:hypothetical protein